MRYILNNENYIEEISFSNEIECNNKTCTEYMGIVPTGYSSLLEWSEIAVIQAYKIVDGNLTHDPDKETALLNEWAIQTNKCVVLYENSSGTTGTVEFTENSVNFSYLEITYKIK